MTFHRMLTEAIIGFEPNYQEALAELTAKYPQYLNNPQYGICGYVVWHIAKELVRRGIDDFEIVEGSVIPNDRRSGEIDAAHTWIEHRGKVYDPTEKQFPSGYKIADHDRKMDPMEYMEIGPAEYGYE